MHMRQGNEMQDTTAVPDQSGLPAKMSGYVTLFFLGYALLGLGLSVLQWLGVPIPDGSGSALAPLLSASAASGWYFARQRGVSPTKAQRKAYSRASLALVVAFALLMSMLTHGVGRTLAGLFGLGESASAGLLGFVVMAATVALGYWLIRLSFGFGVWVKLRGSRRQQRAQLLGS